MWEKIATRLTLSDWSLDPEGSLLLRGKIYVLEVCREEVLKEFHYSRVAMRPGGNKMCRDL